MIRQAAAETERGLAQRRRRGAESCDPTSPDCQEYLKCLEDEAKHVC